MEKIKLMLLLRQIQTIVNKQEQFCSSLFDNQASPPWPRPGFLENKSYINDNPSLMSLDWDRNYSKHPSKIYLIQIPQKLVYQEKYLFSIKFVSKLMRLGEFLQRNRKSLRFGKKVHIYKQIIEFYYLLKYNGIDKQVRFGFHQVYICKNLNVKIDYMLNKTGRVDRKKQSMFKTLLQIYFQIFFDGEQFSKNQTLKSHSFLGFSGDLDKLAIEEQLRQEQLLPHSLYQCTDSVGQQGLNDERMEESRVYERFSQFRHLRHHGDVTYLKLVFTLLFRFNDILSQKDGKYSKDPRHLFGSLH